MSEEFFSSEEDPDMNFQWHLAQSPTEVKTTELEFALMRAYEGFCRWQSECLALVSETQLGGQENALLHIIHMHDRPKSIKELARLTNRDDIPNIQYTIRKLTSAALIERQGSSRTGVTYQTTDIGKKVAENYGAARRKLLIAEIGSLQGFSERLEEASHALNILSGLYEEASRIAATHRR